MTLHPKRTALLTLTLLTIFISTTIAPVAAVETWQSKVDASVLDAASTGQTDFIVYMAAKADLSHAKFLGSKLAKGTYVYETLTETAASSQSAVLAALADLGRPAQSFWIANTIVTSGNLAVIQAIAQMSDVKHVYPLGRGALQYPVQIGNPETVNATEAAARVVGPSIDFVGADDAWALGYKGQGVVVAGADTGVRWTHDVLKNKYRGWNAATSTANHNYNWHDAILWPNAYCPGSSPQPCDDDMVPEAGAGGHGTHTMGTMVGDDGVNQVGMAPDAEWIACRNMNNGFGAVPTYMDCMQWFIAPTNIAGANPDPSKAPDVVNNSWGCLEVCAPPLLKDMSDASRAAGIFYAVSAGNDNQFFLGLTMSCNTINFPLAVYDSSFTVGATDATEAGVPLDTIAYYSSLGPVSDNTGDGVLYMKPDIVAPGTNVRSASGTADDAFATHSGTSMAGPHVAGLVALILSANPRLKGDIETIERIIRQSAKPLTSDLGCGSDTDDSVPNNVYGWGRIDAVAAVELALITEPTIPEGDRTGEPLDPAHNTPLPCELISSAGGVPRSAKNIVHVANVCDFVGTDLEFQSRTDADGNLHDYVFVGTMGAGSRIYDVTDPHLPRYVGGYTDPGWENDLAVYGDTLVLAFDPLVGPPHVSDCLKQKDPTSLRAGVDVVNLQFDPVLAALKAPLTFQTERIGCYLNTVSGGAHTITIHPSGEWLAINSLTGTEVVDLRSNALTFVRKIPSAVAGDSHDVFFSRDGNTMYVAGLTKGTQIVDVHDIFNRAPTNIGGFSNNPPADRGGDGHTVFYYHQTDTTSDGRVLIATDEKGGGLTQTQCNTSAAPNDVIGGAHFWALQPIDGIAKSAGSSPALPMKIGTWIYPNPGLLVDPLDDALAGIGRAERACTIHMFRAGGNASSAPADAGTGLDGHDGVSRLPTNEIVTAHYGAGVWHIDVMSAPGALDNANSTWGRTLGWNVMPGADTWSAKEYKGFVYAGDIVRGLDVYRFANCDGAECVDELPDTGDGDPVGLPASVVPVTKETSTQTHSVTDYSTGSPITGTTTWRVVKDTGNCCENHLGVSSTDRLFDIGGSFVNYSDDRGLTWMSVQPPEPLVNGEGSIATAPNGDVLGVTWDAYSADHLVAYKYTAETGTWQTLTNLLHEAFFDRPWLSVIPGPFTDATGDTVPYITVVEGGVVKDPMYVSTDGLLYAELSSTDVEELRGDPITGWFPISASAGADWDQPIRSSPVTPLGGGWAVSNDGYLLDPTERKWHEWTVPGGADKPSYIQVDSAGRIHTVSPVGSDSLEYRISEDNGQTWTTTTFALPFGTDVDRLSDFKVNRAVGISAIAVRLDSQDWVYKFDISGDTPELLRVYRVGKGDNPAGSDVGAATSPRMDFQNVIIFPDGRVATSFLDSTTLSHPPGASQVTGEGRITPALAIELDTTLPTTLPACTVEPFTDVPIDHPFCAEISWMKVNGISTGYADGTFRPEASVTRMAMSAFLARVAGATPAACTSPPFSDVPIDHPFCPEINWMKTEGISTGYADGTFRPEASVTRMAMSAFLARLADANPPACTSPPFSDVAIDHPFCKEINWMKVNAISEGFPDGTYRPEANVTRMAMAAFLYRTSLLLP
jgi:serine protease AprX